jgi:PKD repeat protein
MKRFLQNSWLVLLAASLVFYSSCKKDKELEVISGFTFTIDQADFKKVTFTNAAQNFETLTWDFGDGVTSTDENPVHTYATVGTFTVTLTAKRGNDTDVSSQNVIISDPDAQLTALVGDVSKTWKLLRTVNGSTWPLEVGPIDRSSVWWGLGRGNDDIVKRECTMNDEWTFGRDGSMTYNSNGDFWAEGGVFLDPNSCKPSDATNLVGENGEDFTAFGDGTHAFTITSTKLTVKGLGAFIGLQKIGTDLEVKAPQDSVTYDIVKLDASGPVDTLIIESKYKFAASSPADEAYWKIVLVAYDDPGMEPPVAGFDVDVAGAVATITNNSYDATSYSWDFGDGGTSAAQNPTHTYTDAGIFTITLTATKGSATATASKQVTISGVVTEANLTGGSWRIRNAANSIVVGPGLGDGSWWQVPANFLDGSSTGGDDWSCMTNDEFIFNANGVYEYKTNGDARNDGYMGSPNGCWSDAEVAASGNGAAFGSGVHEWTFTPAASSPSGRPILTVKNGATGAAFVGFYKGYYGGENGDGANPPNGGNDTNQYEIMSYVDDGTTETLTISVDISGTHDGSAAWTMVLVR